MTNQPRNVVILGSTGSVGRSTLDVIAELDGFAVWGLSAHSNLERLLEQANRFRPAYVIATDAEEAERVDWSSLPESTELILGIGVRCFDIGLLRPDPGAIAREYIGGTGEFSTVVALIAIDAGGRAVLAEGAHRQRVA